METELTKYLGTLGFIMSASVGTVGILGAGSLAMAVVLLLWTKIGRWLIVRINKAMAETTKEILDNKIFRETPKKERIEQAIQYGMNGKKLKVESK